MTTKIFLENQRTSFNHFNYYYFNDVFSNEELSKINSMGYEAGLHDATTGTSTKPTEYRTSKISWIDESDDSKWLYEKVATLANQANKEMWNFDIWGYQDSFQYTKYFASDKGHYDWHFDMGPYMSNRKLSCVLQLSDPSEYEGGELELNLGDNISKVPKKKGLICFFPSFILHRVTEITKGTRVSLVTWLCGANLR